MKSIFQYCFIISLCLSIQVTYASRVLPGSITPHSVGLFWDKPEDYKQIKEYQVYQGKRQLLSTVKNHCTINGLRPSTKYEVWLKYIYNDGKEVKMSSLCFTTRALGKRFDITRYGAKADGKTINTTFIQAAIDACTPNGVVYIPKGVFITGALFVEKNDITIHLEEGAVLKASNDINDFPLVKTRYEGRIREAFASVLNIGKLDNKVRYKNITISGKGTIDGQGNVLADKQTAAINRSARAHGLPIINCDDVYLTDFTIQNPPTWCIHPIFSQGVTTDGVIVDSDGYGLTNADGWDPDSSSDCYLINSILTTHDDHIAIKSGIDAEGREIGIPSENIYVSYCHFRHGGGIAVGSEMSGGGKNVFFEDCTFENADRGFHVKSRPGRGGRIENILFRDLKAERFGRWGLSVDMWYYQTSYHSGEKSLAEIPQMSNIRFENIDIEEVTGPAMLIVGLPESWVSNVTISNFRIGKQQGRSIFRYCENIKMQNVSTNSAFYETDYTKNLGFSSQCDLNNKYDFTYSLVDPYATYTTKALFYNLKKVADQNCFLFGQQDATSAGYGWRDDSGRSDIKDLTGMLPAIYSWDYMDFIRAGANDAKSEKKISRLTAEAYSRGSVNSYCWHFFNPLTEGSFYDTTVVVKHILPGGELHEKYKSILQRVGEYARNLTGVYGENIPVIFRPFHEYDGSWFWWGANHCTPDEFKELYRFTVTYLRDTLQVHNFIYAFSPDCKFKTLEEFLVRYPGDEYVDLIGMDNYWDLRYESEKPEVAYEKLKIISDYARKKNKLCALTETGQKLVENPRWFTETLLKVINGYPQRLWLSYVAVWRNSLKGYYTPYKGHPAEKDFIDFCNRKEVIMEKKDNNLYYIED